MVERRDEKSHLLLGIRHANRQQPALSSSVISSDSMHIGILAAAAHAAANNKPFTIFFNPRASPAEFVIPLAKYNKAMYTQATVGMRFRMVFETEESGVRRYMGTITGVGDLDPTRWKSSQWRSLQVGWDESTAGERPSRVSVWEIEPVLTPFYICPTPFFQQKFPRQPVDETDIENAYKDGSSSVFPCLSLVQWMNMQQQNHRLPSVGSFTIEDPSKLLSFQSPNVSLPTPLLNKANHMNQLVSPIPPPPTPSQQRQQFLHPTGFNQQPQQQQQQDSMNSQLLQQQQQQQQLQQQQQQLQQQQAWLLQRPQQTQSVQHNSSPRQQLQHAPPESLSEQLLLQKLQQQQQQQLQHLLSPESRVEPRLPLQPQSKQQQPSGHGFSTSSLQQPPHFPANQVQSRPKPLMPVRVRSGITNGDVPSASTSPSTNNCQSTPANFVNKNPQGPSVLITDSVVKQKLPDMKLPDQPTYKGAADEQLEASASVASYSLDPAGLPQNFSIPNFCMDGANFPFAANVDSLPPDALSRGFDAQNLLSNYGRAPRDNETELSTAEISLQSFGMPDMSFKPGCSNEVAVHVKKNDVLLNDSGVLGSGLWGNQTPRMRTYTKVQKRGSVGRTIDVTRYKGYEELRRDLARMFGIEGQLEDTQRTGWKLVFVDHEKEILLVGDDPWDEFVSCVQSIKILSYSEVQQMSLDGDLGNVPVPNQASRGTNSENPWKGQYEDDAAASFDR